MGLFPPMVGCSPSSPSHSSILRNPDGSPLPGSKLSHHVLLAGLDFSSLVCEMWTPALPTCEGCGGLSRSARQAPRASGLMVLEEMLTSAGPGHAGPGHAGPGHMWPVSPWK